MPVSFWISVVVLIASLAIYGEVLRGWRQLRQLRDVPEILPSNPPAVSLIVAARNEERSLERAMRSLLAVDYPGIEIIAVDDRSTDATGQILDKLRTEFPELVVKHVRELPPGWLGKNHALHQGAMAARSDYLVFTDADVVFDPSAIRRAVAHCEAGRLDHLTIVPHITASSLFLAVSVMGGFVGILALHRPWRARETGKHGMGVGAFNMVRASSYRAVGGHEALALEVLDDIELGGLMGEGHLRQDILLGEGMVSLEMYHDTMEFFRGIQKNIFTFLDYSAAKLVAASVVTFFLSVWPWAACVLAAAPASWVNVASIAVSSSLYLYLAPRFGYSRWCVVYLPLAGLVMLLLPWQVAIRTWVQGGIVWRGTFYPLAALKAAHRKRGLGSDP